MTFGFLRTVVTDALNEWEQSFPEFTASFHQDPPPPPPQSDLVTTSKKHLANHSPQQPQLCLSGIDSDLVRAACLRDLKEYQCMSFEKWQVEEVFVYCFVAFPRDDLVYVTRRGEVSEFLAEVFVDWQPTLHQWLSFLWMFCGHAHELFGDIISLLPENQRGSADEMANVLFALMDLSRTAAASVAGALVKFPCENTFAIPHAKELFHMMKGLTVTEAGCLCRSLMLHRIMMRSGCHCGYGVGEENCTCRLDMSMDNDKEYARMLYALVLADHTEESLRVQDHWSEDDRGVFIREACEYVFSEHVYTAIHQQLRDGMKPTKRQKHPRVLQDWEWRQDAYKKAGYEEFMKQHMGCVILGCRQMTKKECTNSTCKTHCCEIGMQECRVHRHYRPCPWPAYPWRRSIQPGLLESHVGGT